MVGSKEDVVEREVYIVINIGERSAYNHKPLEGMPFGECRHASAGCGKSSTEPPFAVRLRLEGGIVIAGGRIVHYFRLLPNRLIVNLAKQGPQEVTR